MYSELTANMNELNTIGFKALKQYGSLQAKSSELWSDHQRTVADTYLENGRKLLEARAPAGDMSEALSGFSQMISGFNEQAISHNRKAYELAAKVTEGYQEWAKTNLEEAAAVFQKNTKLLGVEADAAVPAKKVPAAK